MTNRVRWILALTLTLAGLGVAFQGVDWDIFLGALRRPSAVAGLLLVPVVLGVEYRLRTARWSLLVGKTEGLFPVVAASFFLNVVLPFRAGEAARVVLTHRRSGRPMAGCVSALAADRLGDSLALLGVFIVFAAFHGGDFIPVRRVLFLIAVLSVAVVVFASAVVWPAAWRSGLISARSSPRWTAVVDGFLTGVAPLRAPRTALAVAGLSAALWAMNVVLFWGVSLGFGLGLTVVQAGGALAAIALGVALPSTPGFLGVYEAAGVLALTAMGVDKEPALAFVLTLHGAQILGTSIWGGSSLWVLARGGRDDSRGPSGIDKMPPTA